MAKVKSKEEILAGIKKLKSEAEKLLSMTEQFEKEISTCINEQELVDCIERYDFESFEFLEVFV